MVISNQNQSKSTQVRYFNYVISKINYFVLYIHNYAIQCNSPTFDCIIVHSHIRMNSIHFRCVIYRILNNNKYYYYYGFTDKQMIKTRNHSILQYITVLSLTTIRGKSVIVWDVSKFSEVYANAYEDGIIGYGNQWCKCFFVENGRRASERSRSRLLNAAADLTRRSTPIR